MVHKNGGAIYDVYKNLGPGLLESVYEEAKGQLSSRS